MTVTFNIFMFFCILWLVLIPITYLCCRQIGKIPITDRSTPKFNPYVSKKFWEPLTKALSVIRICSFAIMTVFGLIELL